MPQAAATVTMGPETMSTLRDLHAPGLRGGHLEIICPECRTEMPLDATNCDNCGHQSPHPDDTGLSIDATIALQNSLRRDADLTALTALEGAELQRWAQTPLPPPSNQPAAPQAAFWGSLRGPEGQQRRIALILLAIAALWLYQNNLTRPDPEDTYVESIRQLAPATAWTARTSDADLVTIGTEVCRRLDQGTPVSTLLAQESVAQPTFADAQAMGAVMGSAIRNLCPQHEQQADDLNFSDVIAEILG